MTSVSHPPFFKIKSVFPVLPDPKTFKPAKKPSRPSRAAKAFLHQNNTGIPVIRHRLSFDFAGRAEKIFGVKLR